MITRQISDARFSTQWTMPRYGEPSDHGAAFAFTAVTGTAGTPVYLSFAATNAPVALGARVFIRVTAPIRAFLGRGVPGWPSTPNTVWKPTNPIITTNQTVPTLAVNTRVATNTITGQVYTSQQMGDPSITCQLGYLGGVITTMNTASNPQVYNPLSGQEVVTPPTSVATDYWNDAVAAITSIVTVLQLSISAHGFVTLPIVLDEDVTIPVGTIMLIEGYIDGDVRQTAFSSTSNYTVWSGNDINATPLVQTPRLTVYPNFAASGVLVGPSTAKLAANSAKLVPLENLTCANGFEYSGTLDGYQLYMPSTTEAGVPTAGRTAWAFVQRGGGTLTGGISVWAATVSTWNNANRVTPILTPSTAITTGTVSTTSTTTDAAFVAPTTGTLGAVVATTSADALTGTLTYPVTPTAPPSTYSVPIAASIAAGTVSTPAQTVTLSTSTPIKTSTTTTTGTTSTSEAITNIAPAVTESQFSFRLNFASLFTVLVDVQRVDAATGAIVATYPAERCLLSFNAAPAGANRLILLVTNADGTYISIDMDTLGFQSGMTIFRRQAGLVSRSMRGIMSPIGRGSV